MITVFEVQAIKEAEKYGHNGILLDWLLENYPNGFKVPTSVYSGGVQPHHLIAEFEEGKEQDKAEFLRLNMRHDEVYIVMQPLGITLVAIIQKIIIAVAVAVVTNALFPPPKLPEGARQAKGSPNNGVGPQTNVARPLERTPDVFGKDRIYPDLITPGTFEFKGHVKFIEQDFCMSRGFGLIEDVRSGETDFDLISGATKEVFEPGQAPERLLKPRESNGVKALTLNPPNDSGLLMTNEYLLIYNSLSNTGTISAVDFDAWNGYGVGDTLILEDVFTDDDNDLNGEYTIQSISSGSRVVTSYHTTGGKLTFSGDFSDFSNSKYAFFSAETLDLAPDFLFKIISATGSEIILDVPSTGLGTVQTAPPTFLHTAEIDLSSASSVNNNWVNVNDDHVLITGNRVYEPRASAIDEAKDRGPFSVPGDNNFEVWIDIQFPRGLVNDANNSVTVDIEFIFEELDKNLNPTGITFSIEYSFTDNVPDPRFYTRKITSSDGLKENTNYQVTGRRASDTNVNDNTLADQCQWTRLVGIENIAGTDDTGTTRLKVNTQATEQTSSLQESKINLNWTRKTVTWDGFNVIGDIETGVGLLPSKRMADNFLLYALDPKLGARSISQVDADTIYEIQDERDSVQNGETGEFSFTFSNENVPALEELRQICNAARCILIREGSVLSAVRDQANPISTQLFNRRNKLPNSERKTISFNKPLDTDGVTLEYKSDVDDEIKIINIPQDLEPGDPNYGNPTPLNPLKVEAAGIRNKTQAWDRAQYEYNKIIYKRETVETTVTGEALLLSLNDRVDHVDGTRIQSKVSEGEVLGFSGFNVDTSELCEFEDGKTYSVIFRNIDGSVLTALPATERIDTSFGFTLSSSPSLFLRGDNEFQLGSLYSFASDDAPSQSYLVQGISPDSDGNVTLELINYADEYYQADGILPPGVGKAYSTGYSDGYN